MAEEPKKGLKAKLAAAGAALSVFGAAPLPAAAAGAAPAAEKPALELKLTESQLKTAAVSAVAVGGAYAILGNKGGSKMLGPGESRSLGHKVLFKGVPPAPALSSGVSIEDKAGMEKVWKRSQRRVGLTPRRLYAQRHSFLSHPWLWVIVPLIWQQSQGIALRNCSGPMPSQRDGSRCRHGEPEQRPVD